MILIKAEHTLYSKISIEHTIAVDTHPLVFCDYQFHSIL